MSNGERYYVGNFSTDARAGEARGRRRWFVGAMMDEGDHRRTHLVEVKYWDFHTLGPSGHAGKTSTAFECTLILKGRVRADLGGTLLELGAGDYVVIPPGVPNNTVLEILEPAEGITIKAPSDLKNKTELQPVPGPDSPR
jgi:mannose-6-phosphate isomerase-like protein (cupin superfamily)